MTKAAVVSNPLFADQPRYWELIDRMKLPALRSRRSDGNGDTPRRPTAPWARLLRLPRPAELRAAIRKNPGLKLVSIVMAIFLWY